MTAPIDFISRFPTAQREELRAAMKLMRRRVDQNLNAVTLTTNATTSAALLTCPANEIDVNTVLHFRAAGTVTNATGGALVLTPTLTLNGTTLYTAPVSIPTTEDDPKAWIVDARIYFRSDAVIVAEGEVLISPDAALTSVTGTGSLAAAALRSNPFYHTLSSQVRNRDHVVALTMGLVNTLTGTKQMAALWAE